MIVAVTAVRVMKVPLDHVIGVIAVGDRIVPARGAVNMSLVVPAACGVLWSARGRVLPADRERVLVDMIAVSVMEVPVVEEVLVPVVLDPLVAAAGAVLMVVAFVGLVVRHGPSPLGSPRTCG